MAFTLCPRCKKLANHPEFPHDAEACAATDPEAADRAIRERCAAMQAAALRRRKAREAFNDARRPATSGGACPSCHASLNDTDPSDHSCPPDADAPEPVLRRELGRVDARPNTYR